MACHNSAVICFGICVVLSVLVAILNKLAGVPVTTHYQHNEHRYRANHLDILIYSQPPRTCDGVHYVQLTKLCFCQCIVDTVNIPKAAIFRNKKRYLSVLR